MERYERIFKVISEEKRLKVFSLLLKMGEEYYVCEIADALEESHYNTSKYLNDLKKEGLVKEKRVGRGVLYSIKDPEDEFLKNIYKAVLSIPNELISRNMELLKLRVSLREENKCVIGVNDPRWSEIAKAVK
ncbi:MAG: ArsR/SmtB family transcription factor [Dictyoglomus sp.]|uniref:ArsR/SmtB family transcription factor n=1 Tax=Dictyoglomus sp. TaxID=28205 RepID=UPI003D14EF8C